MSESEEHSWMTSIQLQMEEYFFNSRSDSLFYMYNVDDYMAYTFKSALSSDLYCSPPSLPGGLWVLMSESDQTPSADSSTNNPVIKEKIADVLKLMHCPSYARCVLVQFWVPVTTGDRCFLATSGQPFGMCDYEKELCEFRKLSLDEKIYLDTETKKELGPIGRAFIQKSTELLPDLQYSCSREECPHIDHARQCNGEGLMAVPVLDPSSLDCIGVLELVFASDFLQSTHYKGFASSVCSHLKEVGLESPTERQEELHLGVDGKSSIDSDPLPSLKVASVQEPKGEVSTEVLNSILENNVDSFQVSEPTKSPRRTEGLSNGGMVQLYSSLPQSMAEGLNYEGMVQLDSSFSQSVVEYDGNNNGNDIISIVEKSNIVAPSSKKKGKTKTTEKKHRKIATSISFEVLKQYFEMNLEDAAEKLGVSRSTLKRYCRDLGILRWPSHKRNKVNDPLSKQDTPSSSHVKLLDTVMLDERTTTIKATYRDDIIKFELSFSSLMADLEVEIAKRLKLKVGTFRTKYMDEDGDWILIACDADLKNCMSISTSLDTTTIKMLVQPILTN